MTIHDLTNDQVLQALRRALNGSYTLHETVTWMMEWSHDLRNTEYDLRVAVHLGSDHIAVSLTSGRDHSNRTFHLCLAKGEAA